MSLQLRLEALASALGADTKADRITMTGLATGSLAALTTTAKTSLLAAINEVNAKSSGTDPWTYQAITSQISNSTVTAADVFAGFAPVANTRYVVHVALSVIAAATTTGVQLGLTGPTTGVTRSAAKITTAQTASTDMITHTALNTFQVSAAGLTTSSMAYIDAIVEVGASPAAVNIRPQYKSEVAASLVYVNPGSYMRWRTF